MMAKKAAAKKAAAKKAVTPTESKRPIFLLESRQGERMEDFFDRAAPRLIDRAIDVYQEAQAGGFEDLVVVACVCHANYPEPHIVLFWTTPRAEYAERFGADGQKSFAFVESNPLCEAATADSFVMLIDGVDHGWLMPYPVYTSYKGLFNPPGVEKAGEKASQDASPSNPAPVVGAQKPRVQIPEISKTIQIELKARIDDHQSAWDEAEALAGGDGRVCDDPEEERLAKSARLAKTLIDQGVRGLSLLHSSDDLPEDYDANGMVLAKTLLDRGLGGIAVRRGRYRYIATQAASKIELRISAASGDADLNLN